MGALAEQLLRLLVGSANDLTHNTNKGKVEIESKTVEYMKSMDSVLTVQTLDYTTTMKYVSGDMQYGKKH